MLKDHISNDNKMNGDVLDELASLKGELPNMSALKASILSSVEGVPQEVENIHSKQKLISSSALRYLNPLRWYFPIAAAILLAVSVAFLQPLSTDPLVPTVAVEQSTTFTDVDLEWQALMLNEDEFLFGEVSLN